MSDNKGNNKVSNDPQWDVIELVDLSWRRAFNLIFICLFIGSTIFFIATAKENMTSTAIVMIFLWALAIPLWFKKHFIKDWTESNKSLRQYLSDKKEHEVEHESTSPEALRDNLSAYESSTWEDFITQMENPVPAAPDVKKSRRWWNKKRK